MVEKTSLYKQNIKKIQFKEKITKIQVITDWSNQSQSNFKQLCDLSLDQQNFSKRDKNINKNR